MKKNNKLENDKPYFSVIIPTRNRPDLFKKALNSVLSQKFDDYEIVIVNDGSDDIFLENYSRLAALHREKVRYFTLIYRPKGHGSSYARNYGVQMSKGTYVCFLDDDDVWTDPNHLHMAFNAIDAQKKQVDAYYTNQQAFFADGNIKKQPIWLEDLVNNSNQTDENRQDISIVDVDFLLQSSGFSHLNCSIIRRQFYDEIGGMDEDIRYESDRDLYLRTIDASKGILLFNSSYIARHNIPDSTQKNNVSTASSELDKLLYQLRMYSKGVVYSKTSAMRKKCSLNKMYVLKKITKNLYLNKEYKKSASFSRQALAIQFSLKWFLFSVYLSLLPLAQFENILSMKFFSRRSNNVN